MGEVKKFGKPCFIFIVKVFYVYPVKIATDDGTQGYGEDVLEWVE